MVADETSDTADEKSNKSKYGCTGIDDKHIKTKTYKYKEQNEYIDRDPSLKFIMADLLINIHLFQIQIHLRHFFFFGVSDFKQLHSGETKHPRDSIGGERL